ncbi:uncharacterized protein BO95DRAFT_383329 [Aspergillus brunneoviolaceus CBS 621.78]|uniref:Uncharacterized protein n=1 Tax=Aspergillus brunneoviolaceus CBS 621.78 TaxID=1450534 RepID=A0ACD1GH90_9EURO|nr:hypothetical protein BO95DRAFT_383329 [Aspergillus brunneoviolaceus CBS 621.78]RAH48626.1 hypothetical protein BO95DRAFT_383329 [Aspergillus brunneoviolaceus CBS 621.78]
MSTDTHPNNPAQWQKFSQMKQVDDIPNHESKDEDNAMGPTYRSIFCDGTPILQQLPRYCEIYTDVLALTAPEIQMSAEELTELEVNARVITADQPVHLNMSKSGAKKCIMVIYAAVLDQPISVSIEGDQRTELDLGVDSDHLQAQIKFEGGKLEVSYSDRHGDDRTAAYQAFLDTELRVALAVCWSSPAVAISICSWVAKSVATAGSHTLSQAQAVSLGQQLAAHAMTGPDSYYAPTLTFDEYVLTLETQRQAAEDFQDQYERFQAAENQVDDAKAAGEALLKTVQNTQSTRIDLQAQALAKYQSAAATVEACDKMLSDDDEELRLAQDRFQDGLDAWIKKQTFLAICTILGAIFQFAAGIYAVGKGAGDPAAVEKIVEDVMEAENSAGAAEDVILDFKTFKKLWEYTKALGKLYPHIADIVSAAGKIDRLGDHDDIDLPTLGGDVSGSDGTDANASLIMSLAAWDEWELNSDKQMEWATSQHDPAIEGASEYRLTLRKHAVHGRALAQAQAEAVKQGQEYVQATLLVLEANRDIEAIDELLAHYEEEEDAYAQAEAKFYDRYLQLRTTLAIQLQYVVDACRFYTLEEPEVNLDSQMSVEDITNCIAYLRGAMQDVKNQYANGYTPTTPITFSDELASSFPETVIAGLKSSAQGYSATFTLLPIPGANYDPGPENYAYPFTGGFHYRLNGLEPRLLGVKPTPDAVHDGRAFVRLRIETSGTYSDLGYDADTEESKVWHFVSKPRQNRYVYEVDESGAWLRDVERATYDDHEHAQPPPFTLWKLTLENPADLDLSTLEELELHWDAFYRPVFSL